MRIDAIECWLMAIDEWIVIPECFRLGVYEQLAHYPGAS